MMSAYDVDITAQPTTPNQVCTFDTADAGTLAGSDVTINVTCTTTQYNVNINVSGLAATNSVSFSAMVLIRRLSMPMVRKPFQPWMMSLATTFQSLHSLTHLTKFVRSMIQILERWQDQMSPST